MKSSDFTSNAVKLNKRLHIFRDNLSNMRREAVDFRGNITHFVTADALMQKDSFGINRDALGRIADAPWGELVKNMIDWKAEDETI